MRVRALFGLFEGDPDDVVFAGAISDVVWETSDDDEWERQITRLKDNAPVGTTDWREAWIEFDAPDLSPPKITGKVSEAAEQLSEAQEER